MTDFPYVGPPTGGLELAFATARGRRYRKAGFSSGATAFTLAVAALLAGSTGRTTLVQEPAPEIPAVTSVDRVPSGTVDAPTANTTDIGAVAQFGSKATSTSAARRQPLSQLLGPQNSTVRATRPVAAPAQGTGARPGPVTTAMKRGPGSPSIDGCPIQKSASSQRLICPSAYVGYNYDEQNKVSSHNLVGSVCSFDTDRVTLTYATTRELDLVVRDSKGREVWRWSKEHPAEVAPHTLDLSTGSCWEWSTQWRLIDQTGVRVPNGTYTIVATSLAEELGRENTATVNVTVS